jgi:hypothetical protein
VYSLVEKQWLDRFFEEINGLIETSFAAQIQDVIKNTTLSGENYLSIIVGSVTLLIELPQF